VRMQRHATYEQFMLETLVPFIREDCRWPTAPMTAVGSSVGGTYAALFALKYPETFRQVLCMSRPLPDDRPHRRELGGALLQ
jgi:enterochelin esterase-like enzyme